ncbi:hypothetical protein DSO57_1023290 [Entomophthora muscae]|uniref:Uncharacterized protein n=1 Tax=Entomophthora muscae TaxID=34485 RepID=A0ACC2SG88_9FUNG|nr:hypothetical protein DSO57_1023290 [Entomophthora muscae]
MRIALLSLGVLAPSVTAESKCFEHPKPLEKGFIKEVPCGYESEPQPPKFKLKSSVVAGTSSTPNATNKNMIQTSLSCTVSQDICNLVSNTFNTAGIYLSNVIQFNTPVTVQASFYSFCNVSNDCSQTQVTLGQAAAARSVALRDNDGQERLYPQSLVKQIKLTPMPRVSSFDIVAEFNSDANFWFPGSGGTPSRTQVDFLLVVSHELLHGLGFASAYNDYFTDDIPQALTPNPELGRSSSGQLAVTGFYENVFDRHVSLLGTDMTLSNFTAQFNEFASKSKVYRSSNELIAAFQSSPQYSLGQRVLKMATTPGGMGYLTGKQTPTTPNGTLILETSLNPFAVGSSISHVAYKPYSNTEEFLMRYEMAPGSSLSSLVQGLGSWGSEPYGPAVVAVLEKMGYPTNEHPDPNIIASYPNGSKSLFDVPMLLSLVLVLFSTCH